jgi:protein-L-isoaspartate(D-aspartate) O-methyltransferase
VTTTKTEWQARARKLAQHLAESGVLDDPAWRAAFESVPRHVFVPRFYRQQPDGAWSETTAEYDGWLDAVYSDEPLVTALAETATGSRVTVSSSSKPALMARMLAALDVHDGLKVLEIGTGTGYNAALLAHRLGDEHVFSVDIGADLVESARERLAELGYAPTLATVHGAGGLPEHAPYDRIIGTLSVPSVPWAWAEQLRDGGRVLIDVKRGNHAGNLALLHKHPDRLEGRFLAKWASFMTIRDTSAAPPTVPSVAVLDHPDRSAALDGGRAVVAGVIPAAPATRIRLPRGHRVGAGVGHLHWRRRVLVRGADADGRGRPPGGARGRFCGHLERV